jgi:CubicO group peptidase (beta-lactamase class C family)
MTAVVMPRSARLLAAALCCWLPAARAQAPTPAEERIAGLVAAAALGGRAPLREFIARAYAPAFRTGYPEGMHVGWFLGHTGGIPGLTLVGTAADGPRTARAAVRNPLTEEVDSLFLEVEAQAPHGITRVWSRRGAGGAPAETAATDAEVARALDRYVRRLVEAGRFSGVVLLARHGVPLYFEAFGLANRDFAAPVTRDTRFNLGSANKNFTAVVIGQLVEEGRLDWDDPLARFLPDFPDSAAARRIRIRHLLTHTSGLGSYFGPRFQEASRARWRTVDDAMALARPDSLRFEPGTRWAYSNTGYLVLGKVIEVVTGQDYFEVVRERIYSRAGMTASDSYELDRVNPDLAVGYELEYGPAPAEDRWRNNLFEHVIRGLPAGGGYATAMDLVRYSEALRAGTLLRPATLALMRAPRPEVASPRYGYGFVLFEGPEIWGHGGDFPGIDADWNNYGDSGYTLVILANRSGVNDPVKRKVRRLLAAAGVAAAR